MDKITIIFTLEEIEDILSNLEQCESEGYLNYSDPAYLAMNKLKDAYFKWNEQDLTQPKH